MEVDDQLQLLGGIEHTLIFQKLLLAVVLKEVNLETLHAHVGVLLHFIVDAVVVILKMVLVEPQNQSHVAGLGVVHLVLHVQTTFPTFVQQVVLPTEVGSHVGIAAAHGRVQVVAAVLGGPVPSHTTGLHPRPVAGERGRREVLSGGRLHDLVQTTDDNGTPRRLERRVELTFH